MGAAEDIQQRIIKDAKSGAITDFTADDDPSPLPDYDDDFWADRTVSGTWLADWVADNQDEVHRRGIRIDGLRITGGLDLSDTVLTRPFRLGSNQLGPNVINLDRARTRSIDLSRTIAGQVSLCRTRVDGNLRLHGAKLTGHSGVAVFGELPTVEANVYLDEGFSAEGEIRLLGATIGGQLNCKGAHLTNPRDAKRATINADRAEIAGHVLICRVSTADGENKVFVSDGEISLLGATIGGQLNCQGAQLTNPDGNTLTADGATILGGVFLINGFTSEGEIRLPAATIGGQLNCQTAHLTNPNGNTLTADGATILGDVLLTEGVTSTDMIKRFSSNGEIRLAGATITGQLNCEGARLCNPKDVALVADQVTVAKELRLTDGFESNGAITLAGASVGMLCDHKACWPQQLILEGLSYKRISSDATIEQRLEWLKRQTTPSPQPYRQLSEVLESEGHSTDARKVRMARHNHLLHPPDHWRPVLTTGWRNAPNWIRRQVLRYTVGHGYHTIRIVFTAAVLVGIYSVWVFLAAEDTSKDAGGNTTRAFVADDPTATTKVCNSAYPCFQPLIYGLDTIVPLVDLGQRSAWSPNQAHQGTKWPYDGNWLAGGTWIASLVGWAIAILTAASFTNIIKRE